MVRLELTVNIFDIEQRIKQWNERCGNNACVATDSVDKVVDKLKPQMNVIKEEVDELMNAISEKDETEIKDGIVDVLFTSLRLVSLVSGKYDVLGMLNAVCDNNDLKYTTDEDEFFNSEKWAVDDTISTATKCGDEWFYCLKNNNGKVVKPNGFPKVDLSGYFNVQKEVGDE